MIALVFCIKNRNKRKLLDLFRVSAFHCGVSALLFTESKSEGAVVDQSELIRCSRAHM